MSDQISATISTYIEKVKTSLLIQTGTAFVLGLLIWLVTQGSLFLILVPVLAVLVFRFWPKSKSPSIGNQELFKNGVARSFHYDAKSPLRKTPEFLLDAAFWKRTEISQDHSWRDGSNGTVRYRMPDPQYPVDVSKLYWVMVSSALLEQAKRGLKITTATNAIIFPEVTDQGVVIEEIEDDDGTVRAIVAYDLERILSREEYAEALTKYNLGGFTTDWIRLIIWNKIHIDHRDLYRTSSPEPLFKLKLREVVLRQADVNRNPFAPPSTLHGDAAFAWVSDMETSIAITPTPNIEPTSGTFLGWFDAGNWLDGDQRSAVIYAEREGHEIIVGPPGSGKFQAGIAPLILTADEASIIVLDVKNGEAAKTTYAHRHKVGPVMVLDPFGVSDLPAGSLNPLDILKVDDPHILEKAKRLTDALFILEKGSEGKDQYWNDQAKDLFAALLIHVATDESEAEQRTLKRVREIIRRPFTTELIGAMGMNDAAGGIVSDMALNLLEAIKSDAEKNTFLVQQTLRANTAFLDMPTVQAATETTTMNPMVLRERVGTLYVVVPEHELKTMSRWLRLIYAVIMEQMRSEGVPLHVIVDEFASLGAFPRVAEDMARVRYLGIRMHIACQSLNQLHAIYGNAWQDFTGNARFVRVLGANDQFTAEYISKRLGKTTARATSTSQNRAQEGGGSSTSSSWVGVDLMSPDQVTRLKPSEMLVLVEAEKPLRLTKVNLYQNAYLQKLAADDGDQENDEASA